MLRVHASIRSVGIDFRDIISRAKKLQRNLDLARIPIGDPAQIPLFALLAGQRDELAYFAVDNACLIPTGRDILNELEVPLPLVGLWVIGHHHQWTIENYIQSQLMRTGSHGHGLDLPRLELR